MAVLGIDLVRYLNFLFLLTGGPPSSIEIQK